MNTTPPVAGVFQENVQVSGNLTISGVTVQNIMQMVERPPLWVNVPRLPREFLGRDDLVTSLVARLLAGQSPALSAEGLPGVGKTALAVVLAHHPDVLAHFGDGVLWAGLGPQGDVLSALASWGTALGVDVGDKQTPGLRAQAVRNAIGQQRLLLVIDDAWDLTAAEPLRCGGPGCGHLLTTRDQALARAFAGARHLVQVPELEKDPAFELLRRLAPEACQADPLAARRLAQAVGGLPLALELVGGFLAVPEHALFPELSAEAWSVMTDPAQRLRLASVRLGAVDGHQATLQDTIALSLEHLPPSAVDAFHALGAFAPKPATFSLDEAKAVTKAGAATLALLVARNLLARSEREASRKANPEVDGVQLALHQVLADVARTRLEAGAIQRHQDHYLALVDEDREDWQRIQAVYPQVQQALAWQVSRQPDDVRFLEFYNSLRTYQQRQGLWGDYAHLAGQCLTWTQVHQDRRNQASLLNELGYMYSTLGDMQRALAYYNQALPLRRQVGDRAGEAATLNNIGSVYSALGDKPQALNYYNQALPITRLVVDLAREAATLNNIGLVYNALGDKQQALDYFNQALPIVRQVGDRAGESTTLNNLGLVYNALGDMQRALDYYSQALPIARQVGDRSGEATTLNNIGGVYDALGDKQQALDYYSQALPIHRQVGNRAMEATALNNIGAVYSALGDKQQALDYFNKALPVVRKVGDRSGEAATLNNIGGVYAALGDKLQALNYYNQALPIVCQVGDRAGEAAALNNIGRVYDALGDKQQALNYYNQALPIMRHVGDRSGEATALNNMALIYFQQSQPDRTIEMLRRAIELDKATGGAAQEAGHSYNLAVVLHYVLAQTENATQLLSHSIAILQRYHLPQDANGASLAQHQALLHQLEAVHRFGQ